MTDQRTARLFGGHHDGKVATVHAGMLVTGLVLPAPEQLDPVMSFRLEWYEFDGTVNEAGEYRFRWHAS